MIKVKRLSSESYLPTRGSEEAAGLDLYSPSSYTIPPMSRSLIKLDISIVLENGTFGHILPRSGLALKHGIHVGAGVVDSDYRGNVGVLLFNLSDTPFEIKKGDRIAQLVVKKYEKVEVVDIGDNGDIDMEDIDKTSRGKGGFGSTGV